jgi:hypothetical protein
LLWFAAAATFAVVRVTAGVVSVLTGREVGWVSALQAVLTYPLFIAGLALLARLDSRMHVAATVDAFLVAIAAFLALFAAVIRPTLGTGLLGRSGSGSCAKPVRMCNPGMPGMAPRWPSMSPPGSSTMLVSPT